MMEFLNSLRAVYFLGNSGYQYFMALLIFFSLFLLLKIFQHLILAHLEKLAKRTKTEFDDVLIEVFRQIRPPFYFFVAFYFAIKSIQTSEMFDRVLLVLFLIIIVFEVIRALSRFLDYFIRRYLKKNKPKEEDGQHSESMVKLLQLMIKVVFWVIGIIMILSNLGINVNSLIAGLGIGGIAIALALQTVLGDLFSAFAIYIDKPFKIGDFISIGNDRGVVEKIGLKTTRLRTLQGEELVISNHELTNTRIQNFRRMQTRRIAFNIAVTYQTSLKNLRAIPKMVEEIITKAELTKFDRCYFVEYGDSSLIFEVVMFIESRDYTDYLKARQQINLDIYEKFAKAKIDFAYPTQTIYLEK
ncbi:MAG: mechanosensitive ion channel family protein [Patescibacteria group bacterium]|nr:mechanosensitive ion channel family protein [Patescibacteria group bacterium]